MSNIIFIASVLATVIWAFCYVLFETTAAIHIFLVLAFIGTVASVLLDESKGISKR